MSLITVDYGTVGGGLTELWSNDNTTLAAGDITVPNLDKYDTVIFLMNNDDSPSVLRYAGISLSDLSSSQSVGFGYTASYEYLMYRKITHSSANKLTVSTGNYMRNGTSGTGTEYAVIKKIYGVNMN